MNYYSGILNFTWTDIKGIDSDIRNVLHDFKIHLTQANVDRLYLGRNMNGKNLKMVKHRF